MLIRTNSKTFPYKVNISKLSNNQCSMCWHEPMRAPYVYLHVGDIRCLPLMCSDCNYIDKEKVGVINRKLKLLYRLREVL